MGHPGWSGGQSSSVEVTSVGVVAALAVSSGSGPYAGSSAYGSLIFDGVAYMRADLRLRSRWFCSLAHLDHGSDGYPAMVLKFLGSLPRWLTVVLALTAAAALWVVPYLTVSLHGWKLIFSIAFGAVFTMLAVGLPQLQQWQSKQESRIQVELMTEPSELTIPSCMDADGVIDVRLRAEEAECLSSLSPRRSARPPRDFDSEVIDPDRLNIGSGSESSLANISFRDLMRIEEKEKSGEKLTAEEERALVAFQAKMAPIFKGFASGFAAQMLSDPDQRTVEEYRSEVEQYLIRCQRFFDEWLSWEYAKSGIGRLRVTLVNPTGRALENVQVEVYLPGKVKALDPDQDGVNEPAYSLPSRPRAFGVRAPKPLITFPSYSGLSAYIPGNQHFGPVIDNSGSAKVVYRPVTLRPHAHVTLDDIALNIKEPPGSVIEGTWEATATNAEGRMRGRLSVKVDITSVPVRELLNDLLNSLSR